MGAVQFIRCLMGTHHRDRARARFDMNGLFVSECTGCKRPMIKEDDAWHLAEGRAPRAAFPES